MTDDKAILHFGGTEHTFDVIPSSEGSSGINISSLRAASGSVTFDPGFAKFTS